MTGFPNDQGNAGAATPVWQAPSPSGSYGPYTNIKVTTVTSNLTASNAYGAGKVVGGNVIGGNGIWTFAGACPNNKCRLARAEIIVRAPTNGTANFTTAPTFVFAIFSANPTGSTFTDAVLGNFVYSDASKLQLISTAVSPGQNVGTATGSSYAANFLPTGAGPVGDLMSADTNLYLALLSNNTMNPAYTNADDVTITLVTEY